MRFKLASCTWCVVVMASLALFSSRVVAQNSNSLLLFGPVDVRLSPAGTGYGADAATFNSTTLNLTCSASPITAMLSSTADGSGNLIVNNNINVTVTAGSSITGPTNVCTGGVNADMAGPFESCFTTGLEALGSAGLLTGQDPDNFVVAGGVAPLNIAPLLVPGSEQVEIDLQVQGSGAGFYLSSSTLYLDTNCTQGGVTGPALVNGNPIPQSGATPQQLAQDFSFNSSTNQQVGFTYDLTAAQTANTLTITDGTIPQVADVAIDPSGFQTYYVPQTSFATSSCLVHSGEVLTNGQPACKLFTLECAVGTGSTATGAQCPISTQNNELFQDTFNGPAFTLPDIATPNGPTFHQGIGFLMASDGWTGGNCTFDSAADLQDLPCPQNLLSNFSSVPAASANVSKANVRTGLAAATSASPAANQAAAQVASTPRAAAAATSTSSYSSSGLTTHPNSTFITVVQVPEDLTSVTVSGQRSGYWINNSSASVTLSSQPPSLAGTTLPGVANFVASPIESITYGVTPAGSLPTPGAAGLNDTVLSSGVVCPTQANPTGQPATVFTPAVQNLTGLAEGYNLLYYYAQDCAGTEELQFTQDGSGNWSTGFYTYPINVDTVPPAVASGPVLSPAASAQGTYLIGQTVTASYSCTDALSGVIQCGSYTYAPGATNSTGTLTSTVDTSSAGTKTYTVQATDAAGNQSSASVTYNVVSPYDSQIQFSISPQTVTYPLGANVVVTIEPTSNTSTAVTPAGLRASYSSQVPTGTVVIEDGKTKIATLYLQGNGAAYYYLQGLSAGTHILSAVYSGDAHNPGGTSAPVTFTVKPVPVNLGVYCWNPSEPYGEDYICGAYASSNAGPAQGVITYQYDNGSPKAVPLVFGVALFTISKPAVGQHSVVVSYAAQTNYAAANPQTESFTVTLAPVNVGLTPSTWYLTGGNLTLNASVQSWSAGPPRSTGSVTFADGSKILFVVPVNAAGTASYTIAASALSNGNHSFTATYAGGTNYSTGSTSVSVTVAHR